MTIPLVLVLTDKFNGYQNPFDINRFILSQIELSVFEQTNTTIYSGIQKIKQLSLIFLLKSHFWIDDDNMTSELVSDHVTA